jgi:hypothetical protein
MNVMEVYDSFNNQFTLYKYLDNLNNALTNYLDNNNIYINTYCIYSIHLDNVHYLITSNTTKNKVSGNYLITIEEFNCEPMLEAKIIKNETNFAIWYDNLKIIINFDINKIVICDCEFKILKPEYEQELLDGFFKYHEIYNSNTDELQVIRATTATTKNNLFPLLSNLQVLHYNDKFLPSTPLPRTLITLVLGDRHVCSILRNILPNSLLTLEYGTYYNKEIKSNVLPPYLETLKFGFGYNKIINKDVLPDLLKNLIFGGKYDKLIEKDVLPNLLQTLAFGRNFQQQISDILPQRLQNLIINNDYSQHISTLPNSCSITFSSHLTNNKSNNSILPSNYKGLIKHIKGSY